MPRFFCRAAGIDTAEVYYTAGENFAKTKVSHATAAGLGDLTGYSNKADATNGSAQNALDGNYTSSKDADNKAEAAPENTVAAGSGTLKANGGITIRAAATDESTPPLIAIKAFFILSPPFLFILLPGSL